MKLGDFEHLKSTQPPIGILAIYFWTARFLMEKCRMQLKSAERHRDGGLAGAKTGKTHIPHDRMSLHTIFSLRQ